MTEQQLIHGLKADDESAFRLLVESYKDRLYHTILGFLPKPEDAEDVLQDVFIKVYENINAFKGDALLSTWMYRIAVTQSMDVIRKKNRKKRAAQVFSWFGKGEDVHELAIDTTHPGVLTENRELSVHLYKAMQQLPDNQRAAFVLQKIEGLNQQQIADVLHLTVGAVESLLSRAKQNLKKVLTNFYHEK